MTLNRHAAEAHYDSCTVDNSICEKDCRGRLDPGGARAKDTVSTLPRQPIVRGAR
jgi:hypothetical protein